MTNHNDDGTDEVESEGDRQTAPQHEVRLHDSHPLLSSLPDDLADWVQNERSGSPEDALASIVRMAKLRDEQYWTHARIQRFVSRSTSNGRILRTLVERHPFATYQDVFDAVDVSERHVRDQVGRLRDADLVEAEGKPATIRFVDEDVELLARDVAASL